MAVSQWVGDYYVGTDGARMKNCTVDGYYLDATGKRSVQVFEGDYIFVGDSRTVGMEAACGSSDTLYIGKVNAGYTWLRDTAGAELRSYLNGNPDVTVLLTLGVNDLGNIQLYIQYYKELMADYPETRFYVVSVNPVDEKKAAASGYTVKNAQIKAFNKTLKQAFGSSAYINSFKYLQANGIQTWDGLHYMADTYKTLYAYLTAQTQ